MCLTPRFSKRVWSQILFGCSYISCLLSPIVIGIEQKVILGNTLSIVLALCDIFCLRELYNVVKRTYFVVPTRNISAGSGSNSKQSPLYEILLRSASCSCLVTLPIGNMLGLGGPGLAWLSVLRMVCALTVAAVSTDGKRVRLYVPLSYPGLLLSPL